MPRRLALRVAPLVLGSGACGIAYQVAWQREFRLVFGASTAASAAVIAIFIGGLGLGGLRLGRHADRHPSPLALYGNLELGVALLAATTPLLFGAIRLLYVALGGSVTMGGPAANVLRLVLAAAVLAGPTFLMGGTLPAAVCAVERDADAGRRDVSLLYGVNTLGAVIGAAFATFFSLELLGTRLTTWFACLVNLLVAVIARAAARRLPPPAVDEAPAEAPAGHVYSAWLIAGAAAATGFAFFLMELVWYRMLAPLLGGNVFTFGVLLAIVLLGIGLGALANGLLADGRPATARVLALTCLVEAAAIAAPLAFGETIPLLALRLRALGGFGFSGYVLGWSIVAGLVILPAAFAAGVQFPVVVGLAGRGRARVGEELGRVYAWNTAGAIAGAIAGGFGMIPALGAVGCWRLVVAILVLLGVVATAIAAREREGPRALVLPAALAVAAILLVRAEGPGALWRHSPIGVGRVEASAVATANDARAYVNGRKNLVAWETDGIESSVAISVDDAYGFIVNGKTDGNARGDAATQVGLGMLGALFHPRRGASS